MKSVGKVIEINRYPIKSFAGECLDSCQVEPYGIYGDRFYAFYDRTMDGWERFITARQIPNMLAYKAKMVGDQVSVTAPNGQAYSWNEDLLAEIQRYSNKKLSMSDDREPNPENPQLMSVDLASILIITDSTMHKLESMLGKELDPRRFRANLLVSLDDKKMDEGGWIGKHLKLGDTEFKIDCYCQRCSMITLDPETLDRDPKLLKKVHEEMDLHFGVYASVIETGEIAVNDPVYLVEKE